MLITIKHTGKLIVLCGHTVFLHVLSKCLGSLLEERIVLSKFFAASRKFTLGVGDTYPNSVQGCAAHWQVFKTLHLAREIFFEVYLWPGRYFSHPRLFFKIFPSQC